MQALLWYTETLKPKAPLEEHSMLITDVRFSPNLPRLATSSFDKTVRVWDADNVSGLVLFVVLCVFFGFLMLVFLEDYVDLITSKIILTYQVFQFGGV